MSHRPTKEELERWSRQLKLAQYPDDDLNVKDQKRLITEAYDGRRARNLVSEMLVVLKKYQAELFHLPDVDQERIAAVIDKAEEVVA